jgi:hypothetical protein
LKYTEVNEEPMAVNSLTCEGNTSLLFQWRELPSCFLHDKYNNFSGHQTHPLSPAAPTKFVPFSLECDTLPQQQIFNYRLTVISHMVKMAAVSYRPIAAALFFILLFFFCSVSHHSSRQSRPRHDHIDSIHPLARLLYPSRTALSNILVSTGKLKDQYPARTLCADRPAAGRHEAH